MSLNIALKCRAVALLVRILSLHSANIALCFWVTPNLGGSPFPSLAPSRRKSFPTNLLLFHKTILLCPTTPPINTVYTFSDTFPSILNRHIAYHQSTPQNMLLTAPQSLVPTPLSLAPFPRASRTSTIDLSQHGSHPSKRNTYINPIAGHRIHSAISRGIEYSVGDSKRHNSIFPDLASLKFGI